MKMLLVIVVLFSSVFASWNRPLQRHDSYYNRIRSEWEEKIKFPPLREFNCRKKPYTISVEGIVGAGKSTFLEFFKGYPYVDVLPEPVYKWTNLNGTDLLQLIFDNPTRWSLLHESYAQLTMLEVHLRNVGIVKLMERSIHSSRYCFVENYHLTGQMSDVEYSLLDAWYTLLSSRPEFDLQADLTIYLQVDPETVYGRVVKRGRKEEKRLTLDFLRRIHRLYEDWLNHKNSTFPLPSDTILIVNTDHPFETMKKIYRDLAKKVWSVIPKELKPMCMRFR